MYLSFMVQKYILILVLYKFRFVSFRFLVSFRFVSFRFDWFRFVSFDFVSISFRTLQAPRFTCTGKKSRLIFANFVTLKHCWQCANITFFNQKFYSDTQQSLLWRDFLTGWTRRSGSISHTQQSHLWRESLTRWTG